MNDKRLVNGQNRDVDAATVVPFSHTNKNSPKYPKAASNRPGKSLGNKEQTPKRPEKGYIWLRNVGVVVMAGLVILILSLVTCDRMHDYEEQAYQKRLEEYKAIGQPEENELLAGWVVLQEDEGDEDDADRDGLTNATERQLGTDPYAADSDSDGLPDGYEVNVSKTDPLKADTDNDGLRDGDELDLGLNSLLADSRGDGVRDGERTLQAKVENQAAGVTLDITGRGNIASATIDKYDNPTFANTPGLLGAVYNFHTDGQLQQAQVALKYDLKELAAKDLQPENLTLYYFNEDLGKLEAVPTTVDVTNQTLRAELQHFSRYVVGDKTVVLLETTTDVMFVIDNSVSMYTNEQMSAAGYEATGAVGNDQYFRRLSLTNRLIDRLNGNYRYGVGEFSGDYATLMKFNKDQAATKKAVDGMNSNWTVDTNGTDIAQALESGIKEFSTDDNEHYMILLTDGKDTSDTLADRQRSIMEMATSRDVKVCVIGLGTEVDAEILTEIAESTGCAYYNASDSAALDAIYDLIGASINYNYVDTDDDGTVDGMIVADSGFITSRDGFSFKNFASNKSEGGHCFGMATFAMLRYMDKLTPKMPPYSVSKFMPGEGGMVKAESDGYDLSGTYLMTGGNLYDFQFTTPGLKVMLQSVPDDYRDHVENDTWMIKPEYYEAIEKLGTRFTIEDWTLDERDDFSKFQYPWVQINNAALRENSKSEESGVLDAIWRYFILQFKNKKGHFFSTDPDKTFKYLVEDLLAGQPDVLEISCSMGSHAINAVRLVQDLENPDLFRLEVYDNNHPGERRYMFLTRKKYNKIVLDYTAWTNEYSYKAQYDYDNDGTADDVRLSVSEIEVR